MTHDEMVKLRGFDLLAMIARNLGECNGTFLDQFTAEQLIQIGRMHLLCDYDIHPDQWHKRQVKEALAGIVPQFTRTERPKFTPRSKVSIGADMRSRKVKA